MKKVLKEKSFVKVEKVQQKTVEALKKHQNGWAQKLFWAVEKLSWWVYRITWRALWRWLKFKHVRTNTQYFPNKFQGFGVPLVHFHLNLLNFLLQEVRPPLYRSEHREQLCLQSQTWEVVKPRAKLRTPKSCSICYTAYLPAMRRYIYPCLGGLPKERDLHWIIYLISLVTHVTHIQRGT